jgi:hypothetical protein
MADYYPVLVRAVSRLAMDSAQARQELYEHARTFLVAQLRKLDPQISAPKIIRERAALETAIFRLEAESPFAQTRAAISKKRSRTATKILRAMLLGVVFVVGVMAISTVVDFRRLVWVAERLVN